MQLGNWFVWTRQRWSRICWFDSIQEEFRHININEYKALLFQKRRRNETNEKKKFPEWQSNKTTGFIFYDKLKSLFDIQRRKSWTGYIYIFDSSRFESLTVRLTYQLSYQLTIHQIRLCWSALIKNKNMSHICWRLSAVILQSLPLKK
jgi:hypothetical protein